MVRWKHMNDQCEMQMRRVEKNKTNTILALVNAVRSRCATAVLNFVYQPLSFPVLLAGLVGANHTLSLQQQLTTNSPPALCCCWWFLLPLLNQNFVLLPKNSFSFLIKFCLYTSASSRCIILESLVDYGPHALSLFVAFRLFWVLQLLLDQQLVSETLHTVQDVLLGTGICFLVHHWTSA